VTHAIVTTPREPPHETAELAHEALIHNWPTLAEWIRRDRSFLSWRQDIKSNMEEWSGNKSEEGLLLRGNMLVRAEGWLVIG